MATMSKPTPEPGISHVYNADARLLDGELQRPVGRKIDGGVFSKLGGMKDRHIYKERPEPYDLDGLISFERGYTRVSGSHPRKRSWVSIATCVLEDLNILDVITADRVVAQASTEHSPFDGHVPSVTFVGSGFENLRINGYPVQPELELGICGDKPEGDAYYFDDPDFLDGIERQTKEFAKALAPPDSHRLEYDKDFQSEYTKDLQSIRNAREYAGAYDKNYKKTTLKCSIVKSIPAIPVATSFGNVLHIPGFGVVTFGKLEIEQEWTKEGKVGTYFDLTMLEVEMGSIAQGSVQVANVGVNGLHKP
jgi:hypothetical protein